MKATYGRSSLLAAVATVACLMSAPVLAQKGTPTPLPPLPFKLIPASPTATLPFTLTVGTATTGPLKYNSPQPTLTTPRPAEGVLVKLEAVAKAIPPTQTCQQTMLASGPATTATLVCGNTRLELTEITKSTAKWNVVPNR